MTLRSRLALAMMAAAVLPMAVTVAVLLARADARAGAEAQRRLELARRQATFLVQGALRDVDDRIDRAAAELGRDRAAQESVIGGPEGPAREVAKRLSERHGLEIVEISGPGDADLRDGPAAFDAPAGSDPASARPRVLARRAVPLAREPLAITGGAQVAATLVAEVAEMTGEPAALIDPSGRVAELAGDEAPGPWMNEFVALGSSGWSLRVGARAADVARERRDLIAAVTGLAPFALLSALAVGVFLAGRISGPIRALADRADGIAAERAGFALVDPPRDEVVRLKRSFQRMLDALSGSERQRVAAERIAAWREVAQRIAHEVKNPLSPIQLAVENLRRTREIAPGELDRALEEESATILEEVESLRRLVDEFSQFARLPAPDPAPCDPRVLARQALALFAPRIEELAVRLEVRDEAPPETIEADAEQLGRALKNLLANALDALESAGDRRLTLTVRRAAAPYGPCVEIEVRDTGRGFDREVARRIFEPYFTTRGDRGGTGLGLAIAYRVAAEHGGTIEAEGAPGRGAVFTLRIPERWQAS